MDKSRLEELFAPFGPVTVKRMFGGAGVYADDLCFAICIMDDVFLKADDISRPLYEAEDSRPFAYEKKNGSVAVMSFWRLPEAALDDEEALRRWSAVALESARRAKIAKDGAPARKANKSKLAKLGKTRNARK